MTTTTRLYTANAAAWYTPPTVRGTWTDTEGSGNIFRLSSKAGAAATLIAWSLGGGTWTLLVSRWVSDPIKQDYSFTAADTIEWLAGVEISSTVNAASTWDVFAYVTTGNTDTPRGTILTNTVGSTAIDGTATGHGDGAKNLTATVNALKGDRVVVEMGVRKTGTATGTRTWTQNYGNTGGTDLTEGSVNVTIKPGWIELVTASDPWAAGATTRRVMSV